MTDPSMSISPSVPVTLPEPMLLLSRAEMRILAANDAAAQLTGYSSDQLLQSSLIELLVPNSGEAFSQQMAGLSPEDILCLGGSIENSAGHPIAVSLCFRSVQEEDAGHFILTIKREESCPERPPAYIPDSRFPLMPLHANTPICVAVFDGPEHQILSTNRFNIAITLFRIFQETLTNVAGQAKAKAVRAHIWNDASSLSLTITDDGIGVAEDLPGDKSTLGLLGMRERIAMLHGEFSIFRNGDNGTVTHVVVPYAIPQGLNHESHA